MTDEWTRAEKRKAQSEQAKAIMDFVSMLSDKITELEKENAELIQENEEMKKGLGCETCQIYLEYMRLNDKIRELEEQIEKMKCCKNCKFKDCDKSSRYQTCWYCTNKDKWKLRR